jgi:hypothetical protein
MQTTAGMRLEGGWESTCNFAFPTDCCINTLLLSSSLFLSPRFLYLGLLIGQIRPCVYDPISLTESVTLPVRRPEEVRIEVRKQYILLPIVDSILILSIHFIYTIFARSIYQPVTVVVV